MSKELKAALNKIKNLEQIIQHKNAYIEQLGDISDTCTKRETGNVCLSCRCGKKEEEHPNDSK